MIDAARRSMGHLDTALIAHGVLPDQSECQFDASAMLASFEINALSTMSIVTLLANEFDFQGHGTIGVIGSVAGDRGRQSNYVYGAAKGALSIFLQGVRHRLSRSCTSRVNVVTIKPGLWMTP